MFIHQRKSRNYLRPVITINSIIIYLFTFTPAQNRELNILLIDKIVPLTLWTPKAGIPAQRIQQMAHAKLIRRPMA